MLARILLEARLMLLAAWMDVGLMLLLLAAWMDEGLMVLLLAAWMDEGLMLRMALKVLVFILVC